MGSTMQKLFLVVAFFCLGACNGRAQLSLSAGDKLKPIQPGSSAASKHKTPSRMLKHHARTQPYPEDSQFTRRLHGTNFTMPASTSMQTSASPKGSSNMQRTYTAVNQRLNSRPTTAGGSTTLPNAPQTGSSTGSTSSSGTRTNSGSSSSMNARFNRITGRRLLAFSDSEQVEQQNEQTSVVGSLEKFKNELSNMIVDQHRVMDQPETRSSGHDFAAPSTPHWKRAM